MIVSIDIILINNLFRNEFENLKVISCTDKKCAWNAPKQSALQKYDMNPLMTHSCFLEKIKKSRERKLKATEKKSYMRLQMNHKYWKIKTTWIMVTQTAPTTFQMLYNKMMTRKKFFDK